MYTYEHPHPSVTTDCVIFGYNNPKLYILLIKRRNEPFAGKWALPGGYVDIKESCENAAVRELQEETGLKILDLKQLKTFSEVSRDPRERTISVVFYGETRIKESETKAGDDATEAKWFHIYDLPELAFDHKKIIDYAIEDFRKRSRLGPIGYNLMPEKFRFNELYKLYEALLGTKLNRILFKNKIDRMGHLLKVEENVNLRNPLLKFNEELYEKLQNEGCYISLT
ncbi:MAG: NUDIX domain-containing protein [Cytophagaceae bacterium]